MRLDEVDVWYEDDGQPSGPITLESLRALYVERAIGPETLVWFQGAQAWQPLAQTALYQRLRLTPPPLPDVADTSSPDAISSGPDKSPVLSISAHESVSRSPSATLGSHLTESTKPTGQLQARPLEGEVASSGALTVANCPPASAGQRFAARAADFAITFPPLMLPFAWLPAGNGELAIWILLLGVLFIEAGSIARYGNSVGKALVGIRVRLKNGRSWTMRAALERVMRVWVSALALGLPVFLAPLQKATGSVVLVTFALFAPMIWQWWNVVRLKPTTYDEHRYVVYRHRARWWRTFLVFCVASGAFVFFVVLASGLSSN